MLENIPKFDYLLPHKLKLGMPQEEVLTIGLSWSLPSPTTVGSGYASAVCWLYGRMIHEGLGGRPIGLIHTSWGGTDIEYWTPPEVLKDCGITR